MSIQSKIAERLREVTANESKIRRVQPEERDAFEWIARMFEDDFGTFDDVIGVNNPVVGDVLREARRVYGDATVQESRDGHVMVFQVKQGGAFGRYHRLDAPTVESAYRALLALPDKVTP